MKFGRREFITAASVGISARAQTKDASEMYGLIGKMIAAPGQRDTLIEILLQGVADMPGCLSYIIAKDPTDENALWITEAWDSKANHDASLSLPAVKTAITKAKPIIAGFGERFVTTPIGGTGLGNSR